MHLLERVQTTFSGWRINTAFISSPPPWAKKLSQIIRDSSTYKFVSNNQRTIGLVGIGAFVTIGLIARFCLKLKAKFEQSNQQKQKISTELSKTQNELRETKETLERMTQEKNALERQFEANKNTSAENENKLRESNDFLQAKLNNALANNQGLEKQLASERKAPQEALRELTEENNSLKSQLATLRSDILIERGKVEETEKQLSGVKKTLVSTEKLLKKLQPKAKKTEEYKKESSELKTTTQQKKHKATMNAKKK